MLIYNITVDKKAERRLKMIVKDIKEFEKVKDNLIIAPLNKVIFKNSYIKFEGKNNICYFEEGIHLQNSNIIFSGNNSIMYLSKNKHLYKLNVWMKHDGVFFMGENNYINGTLNCILSEQKNIVIGKDGLYSFGIWIRIADPHLIYDAITHKRINPSKSIYIGDHVWLGQGVTVLKGTKIGSGSICGAMSLISGGG